MVPTWLWILIALAVLVLLAFAAWSILRAWRRQRLRERFRPEYDRSVAETGKPRRAEAELRGAREAARSARYPTALTPLLTIATQAHGGRVQEQFVDEPSSAVADADRLVGDVMRDHGYSVDNFKQRAADVSVDHPHVVEHCRVAHAVHLKKSRGAAGTKELLQAFVH